MCSGPIAYASTVKEDNVKAAILYNLARFSEWSSLDSTESEQNFRICIAKNDKMTSALIQLAGKPIHGRALEVLELDNLAQVSNVCQILFISDSDTHDVNLLDIADMGVLTVGDGKKFLKRNGGIAICRVGNKMRFSINRSTMAKANIVPSSKILNLAAELR
jgi:hypothetical protein